MRIYCFLLFLLSSSMVFGQVDYEAIKKRTSDEENEMYYPHLIQRFIDSDSTLTIEDFQSIYYGVFFHKPYDLDKIIESERTIRLANYSGEYLEAYELADNLLKEYPVSIQAYFEKAYACYNLKRFEEEAYNTKRYKILITTILSSGDGKTFETAYHANLSNDKYEVIKFLHLEYKEESEVELDGKVFDVFSLKSNKQKQKILYFSKGQQQAAD